MIKSGGDTSYEWDREMPRGDNCSGGSGRGKDEIDEGRGAEQKEGEGSEDCYMRGRQWGWQRKEMRLF